MLVKQLAIKVQGRDDIKIDLTGKCHQSIIHLSPPLNFVFTPSFTVIGNISKLKESPIVIKEGSEYRVEITFRVSTTELNCNFSTSFVKFFRNFVSNEAARSRNQQHENGNGLLY